MDCPLPDWRYRRAFYRHGSSMSRLQTFARRLRTDQTSAEARLWGALRSRRFDGRKFRRQHEIDGFIVDFVCLDARLIIEIDGATHGAEAEVRMDARRTRILETSGYAVMRVQNEDVRTNLAGVLDAIWLELRQRTHF
jgi:very-short-patch-repair endonuclease